MIFLLGELLFLVVLNDGLRCGVVDSKLLGNLSNNSCSYIDDTHSFLNVFQKFLRFGNGPSDAVIVNNSDWLDSLKYIEFLRDYGRFMSVNRMLTFESVKQRLNREQPLSFLEFNYMLLQAYDFVKLNETHNVTLQLGGSDQWGNIVCGVELARKTSKV